jgi:hypothetical protein
VCAAAVIFKLQYRRRRYVAVHKRNPGRLVWTVHAAAGAAITR